MVDLDDVSLMARLDASNMRGSILALAKQCGQAWQETQAITLPTSYRQIRNVVVCGMGGSALGIDVIKSLYAKALPVPVEVVRDYHLPGYAGDQTLVIISSYSGTTEEALSCLDQALQRGAKIAGIASGGILAQKLKELQLPGYIFQPVHNPSNQPRMGLGYSIIGSIGLLANLELIQLDKSNVDALVKVIEQKNQSLGPEVPSTVNPAKKMAKELVDKIPIVFACEHLSGNAHALANQFNENAKTFAAYFLLPEVNHHLLESLSFPQDLAKQLAFIFLESGLYTPPLAKRMGVTKQLMVKRGMAVYEFGAGGGDLVEQAFETLTFGSWLVFYLAMANNIDPSPIPNVDYFKEAMKK